VIGMVGGIRGTIRRSRKIRRPPTSPMSIN
jgi:hypothetical protein